MGQGDRKVKYNQQSFNTELENKSGKFSKNALIFVDKEINSNISVIINVNRLNNTVSNYRFPDWIYLPRSFPPPHHLAKSLPLPEKE